MPTVAGNPVAISYKTISLAELVEEPLKTTLAKAIQQYESAAVSAAKSQAASLHSQFLQMGRQYSGTNEGVACYAAPRGLGGGAFTCPNVPAQTCADPYQFATSDSGGEISFSVKNPRYRYHCTIRYHISNIFVPSVFRMM